MFQEDVQKIETHFLYSIIFFFENLAVCEIVAINMIEADMPQMTV